MDIDEFEDTLRDGIRALRDVAERLKAASPSRQSPPSLASTDACGKRREPATINGNGAEKSLLRGKAAIALNPYLGDEEFDLLADLILAHNAYFCTDPSLEEKINRALDEALDADAKRRATKAAEAIIYGLLGVDDIGQNGTIIRDLVTSHILAAWRA